jgi:hypothetical protein
MDTKLKGDIAEQAAILHGLRRGGVCSSLSGIGYWMRVKIKSDNGLAIQSDVGLHPDQGV